MTSIDGRITKLERLMMPKSAAEVIEGMSDEELHAAIVEKKRAIVVKTRNLTPDQRRAEADEVVPGFGRAIFGKSPGEQLARRAFIAGDENDRALQAWIADTLTLAA